MSIQTRSQESYESVDTSGYLQEKIAFDRQSDDVNFLRDAILSRAPKSSYNNRISRNSEQFRTCSQLV